MMIGSVANMIVAACSTSGVVSAAADSAREIASLPELSTMLESRYCSGCSDLAVM